MQNFDRHGVYVEVSEDKLLSWNAHSKRASEVIDMMWVLRKKRDEKEELLKCKARAVVCGNQHKRKATAADMKHTFETFAPSAARSATFKLLCALDVEAAYFQGKCEGDDGELHVRHPPDERFFDDREVPIVWKLLKPQYGEADARRIWHRTAEKQLVQVQGFKQSKFNPCYFYTKYPDGHRVDLILYVDDCWMADTGSEQAYNDVQSFCDRFKLTMQDRPKQFLGLNIDMRKDGGVKISASAY
eukprot:6030761-Pleurochrysis_carterae.AAC.1